MPTVAALCLVLLSSGTPGAVGAQTPAALSRPPGVDDPVSAAVAEASRRFGVPVSWIRSVMRIESAGRAAAVSHAGAMGLMQVMPGTYAELRSRYGLGPDPFDVRDNVLAGTAYLREMFDRYGAPGFLAAYNAGPGRWEEHLSGARPLPSETIDYVGKLGPMLETGVIAAPPVTVPAALPLPFAAPIFVALHGPLSTVATGPKHPDIRQIIIANTTIVPSQGDLFMRRERASSAPPNGPDTAAETGKAAQPATTSPPREQPSSARANRLFVPRSGASK